MQHQLKGFDDLQEVESLSSGTVNLRNSVRIAGYSVTIIFGTNENGEYVVYSVEGTPDMDSERTQPINLSFENGLNISNRTSPIYFNNTGYYLTIQDEQVTLTSGGTPML